MRSKYKVGEIVTFKKPPHVGASPPAWIDIHGHEVQGNEIGMIVKSYLAKHEDDMQDWEYDIHVPSCGFTTEGWGDFAFKRFDSKN